MTTWGPETILRSGDLRIDFVRAPVHTGTLLCCFTSFNHRSLSGTGFAGKFAADNGMDLVAVKNTANDFYQQVSARTFDVVDSHLSRVGLRWATRATYGSSMGAYAAIHFAPAFRADRVLALSPRYDLAQTHANPWRLAMCSVREVRRLGRADVRQDCDYVLVYDSLGADRVDVERYAEVIPPARLRLVPIPYGGHPVGGYLQATGLLKSVSLAALTGAPMPACRPRCREARGGNATHLANLGAHCFRAGKFGWAQALTDRAIRLEPGEWHHHLRAAQIAELRRRPEEAARYGRAGLEVAPDQPQILLCLARLASRSGALDAAVDYAERGLRFAPGHSGLVALRDKLERRRVLSVPPEAR